MADFKSNQNLADSGRVRMAFPEITEDAVTDYLAKTIEIIMLQQQSAPVFGAGSPEGVVTSTFSQLYIDTNTNTWYSNQKRDVNTGWVAK